jgi:hypothetical protein
VQPIALNPDSWWDELGYRAAPGSFSEIGKVHRRQALEGHDAARVKDVLGDLYPDAVPDAMDITKFEWKSSCASSAQTSRRSRMCR